MSESLGKAVLELDADQSKLDSAIDKAGAGAKSRGAKIEAAFSKAAKVSAVALTAIGGATVYAVKAASNLEEQVNKTSVVFGKSSKPIQEWAKTTAESIGLSNRAALEYSGTFGNMLVPMGFVKKKAADMSKSMVTLAADMASFNNASPEEVLESLRAGLSGETEPLRKFGVFLNEDRIKLEAVDSGLVKAELDMTKAKDQQLKLNDAHKAAAEALKKYGKKSDEYLKASIKVDVAENALAKTVEGKVPKLNAAQKAQATYNIIMKDTTAAQGDFKRTSGSLANQQRLLKAQVEDAAAAFGQAFLPAAQKVMTLLMTLLGVLRDHQQATKILVGVVVGLAAAILLVNAGFKIYSAAAKLASVYTWLFVGSAEKAAAVTKLQAAAQWLLNAAMSANPIALIVAAIVALGIALVVAYKKSETFRDIVQGAMRVVKTAIDSVVTALQAVVSWLKNNWPLVAALLAGPFAPIVLLATDGFGIRSKIIGAFQSVIDWFKNTWSTVSDKITGALKTAKTWVAKHWPEIATLISGPFAPIVLLATGAFGIRKALLDALGDLKTKAGELAGKIGGAISGGIGAALSSAKSGIEWLRDKSVAALQGTVKGFEKVGSKLRDAFQPFATVLQKVRTILQWLLDNAKKIGGLIGKVGGWAGKIPGFAAGGPFGAGEPMVVGERGPELAVFGSSGRIIPNSALMGGSVVAAGGAGGNVYHLNFEGPIMGEQEWIDRVRKGLASTGRRVGIDNLFATA